MSCKVTLPGEGTGLFILVTFPGDCNGGLNIFFNELKMLRSEGMGA